MSWKTCDNCGRKPTCDETSKYWCNHLPHEKAFWQPFHCPLCGGSLSEIREHRTKVGDEEKIRYYRHCYSCNMEFYEQEEEKCE